MDTITLDLDTMSRESLIAIIRAQNEQIATLKVDPFTGLLNAQGAICYHSRIPFGKTMVFVDMANVHAQNHKYGMNGVNQFWCNVFSDLRLTDIVIKWGGDEFIIIINDDATDVDAFIARLDAKLHQNQCYAVFGIVTTTNDLLESAIRADTIVSEVKYNLELNGMKPSRDETYKVLDSHVVYE